MAPGTRKYSKEENAAIRETIEAAARLVDEAEGIVQEQEVPVIVQERLSGKTLDIIATTHNNFGCRSRGIAISALSLALQEVLPEDKRKEIAAETARYGGIVSRDGAKGLFDAYHQSRLATYGKRGGAISGANTAIKGIGLHRVEQDHIADGKKAGTQSAINRGYVPYTPRDKDMPSELEFAASLRTTIIFPEDSSYAGKPDWTKIAEMTRDRYHPGDEPRSNKVLRTAVYRTQDKL
ncbi:MAG: hypothetical protein ABIH82_01015 [Candidatus Woesearchaeota archaeon]